MINVEPTPSWLSTEMVPPCSSTVCRALVRPMPCPPIDSGHVTPPVSRLENLEHVAGGNTDPLIPHREDSPGLSLRFILVNRDRDNAT